MFFGEEKASADPSQLNVSIFASFSFRPNVLLVHQLGGQSKVLFFHGDLLASLPAFLAQHGTDGDGRLVSSSSLHAYLHHLQLDEAEEELPPGVLRLSPCRCVQWERLLRCTDVRSLSLLSASEWKQIFRYARLRDELDRVKSFLAKAKILAKARPPASNGAVDPPMNWEEIGDLLHHFHSSSISLQHFFLF